jgi:hypothetical protein
MESLVAHGAVCVFRNGAIPVSGADVSETNSNENFTALLRELHTTRSKIIASTNLWQSMAIAAFCMTWESVSGFTQPQ